MAAAQNLVKGFYAALAAAIVVGVTVSVGVATMDESVQDTTAFLHLADRQLYQAKSEGRNKVCG